jgi:hypothetical protein
MSLRVLTASGDITLGTPPPNAPPCDRCHGRAQLAVEDGDSVTLVCAPCAEALITDAAPERLCGRGLELRGHGWLTCTKPLGHEGGCA